MSEVNQNTAEAVALIPLADICKELGIKPSAARIKLRKKLGNENKGEGFRWSFTEEQKANVVATLTAKPAAKEAEEVEAQAEEGESAEA